MPHLKRGHFGAFWGIRLPRFTPGDVKQEDMKHEERARRVRGDLRRGRKAAAVMVVLLSSGGP
jgi:hypothetical protein